MMETENGDDMLQKDQNTQALLRNSLYINAIING